MLTLSGLLVTGACRSRSPQEDAQRQLEEARARAVEEAEAESELAPGEYVVTPEKLDSFVRYQQRMVEVYGTLVRDTQRLMGRRDGGLAVAQQASGVLAGKARAEEELRQELKLSSTDVRILGAMATEIASRRSLARALRLEDAMVELEDAKTRLGTQRKEELEKQLEELRGQQQALVELRDARAKWGDANVELLLTREAELTKNYQDMLAQFSGPERPRAVEITRDAGSSTSSDAGGAPRDAGVR